MEATRATTGRFFQSAETFPPGDGSSGLLSARAAVHRVRACYREANAGCSAGFPTRRFRSRGTGSHSCEGLRRPGHYDWLIYPGQLDWRPAAHNQYDR